MIKSAYKQESSSTLGCLGSSKQTWSKAIPSSRRPTSYRHEERPSSLWSTSPRGCSDTLAPCPRSSSTTPTHPDHSAHNPPTNTATSPAIHFWASTSPSLHIVYSYSPACLMEIPHSEVRLTHNKFVREHHLLQVLRWMSQTFACNLVDQGEGMGSWFVCHSIAHGLVSVPNLTTHTHHVSAQRSADTINSHAAEYSYALQKRGIVDCCGSGR